MKVRMVVEISQDLAARLDEIVAKEDITKSELMRRTFSLILAMRDQRKAGRKYIGAVEDPAKLDCEFVGMFGPG